MAWTDRIALRVSAANERATITILAWSFLALLCVSLVLVSQKAPPAFHIKFDGDNVLPAALSVAAFISCVPLFASSRCPLGFAASFYLLTVTAGYLWLSYFTPLQYDHVVARFSAVASWAAFALPTLLITKSIPMRNLLTYGEMNWLAGCLIFVAAAIAIEGYLFGFHFVGLVDGESLRDTLDLPTWMRYAITISATTILPFTYAWFLSKSATPSPLSLWRFRWLAIQSRSTRRHC